MNAKYLTNTNATVKNNLGYEEDGPSFCPPLEGSQKQVKWALDLREIVIARALNLHSNKPGPLSFWHRLSVDRWLNDDEWFLANGGPVVSVERDGYYRIARDMLLAQLYRETSAAWFIDRRDATDLGYFVPKKSVLAACRLLRTKSGSPLGELAGKLPELVLSENQQRLDPNTRREILTQANMARSEHLAAMLRRPLRPTWVFLCILRDKEWYEANGGAVTDAEMNEFRDYVAGMLMEAAPKETAPNFWTQPANFSHFEMSYVHPMKEAVIAACRALRVKARQDASTFVGTACAT